MRKTILLCGLLFLMLLRPAVTAEGARYGLLLWYSSVVPALFPFMVLSRLIVSSGGLSAVMRPFYRILHPLFGLSAEGCYTLLAGFLCGCPMGAGTCAGFMEDGRIAKREGRFLIAVCNLPGPMFLLGYVCPLLADYCGPARVLVSFYAPLLVIAPLAAVIYRPRLGPSGGQRDSALSADRLSEPDIGAAILSSAELLVKIGGFLMLYSIAVVFLRRTTAFPACLRLFLIAVLEMTTGVRETATSLPFPLSGAAVCASAAFGSFSALSQTRAALGGQAKKNAGLSIRHYFLWKLLHASLSAALFLLL